MPLTWSPIGRCENAGISSAIHIAASREEGRRIISGLRKKNEVEIV